VTSDISRDLAPAGAVIPLLPSRRQAAGWREAALCRREDTDLFFPITSAGPPGAEASRAKAVCASCPVRRPCLLYALATGQEFGIWGGYDENERRLLRCQQREPGRVSGFETPGYSDPGPVPPPRSKGPHRELPATPAC
jgi:WhiB family transcriptional regulator, redox-sensing transcriptional regulator